MQKTVHYSVEIDCAPCPEGYAAQIARQLQTAFPVTVCQHTPNGLAMRLTSAHPFADGALKDFADLVGETLTGLGIRMTCGVVRRVAHPAGAWPRLWRAIAAAGAAGREARLTGEAPAREVPVLYFYKGLRFDRELSARLRNASRRNPSPAG